MPELPDMLNARERRVWMQEQLLSEFPGVLVSFTLNIPGPVKDPAACSGGICLCTFGDRFRVGYRKDLGLKAQPNPR